MVENSQISVARRKFSGVLPSAQLEYKLYSYSKSAEKSYDPKKGSFDSHLANHLNKLNRDVHNSVNALGISEVNGLSIHKMNKAKDEFSMKHDRDPSTEELSSLTGLNGKFINKYSTGSTLAISREMHIGVDDIDFASVSRGLDKDDMAIASASLNGGKMKGMSRATFFRKSKNVKQKMRGNFLRDNTVVLHGS